MFTTLPASAKPIPTFPMPANSFCAAIFLLVTQPLITDNNPNLKNGIGQKIASNFIITGTQYHYLLHHHLHQQFKSDPILSQIPLAFGVELTFWSWKSFNPFQFDELCHKKFIIYNCLESKLIRIFNMRMFGWNFHENDAHGRNKQWFVSILGRCF